MSDVLVLCYHGLSSDWPSSLAVRPRSFEEQLTLLVERGYRGVTFSQAVLDAPGDKVLAVTFDDGFESVLREAVPIMRRLGLPGTVFVCTDFVGSKQPMRWSGIQQWSSGPYSSEVVPMTWDELRSLAASGWEVGSHTRSHARLPAVGDDELDDQLARSRDTLEQQLGEPCLSVAYPYGDYDERVVEAARAAGYRAAATLALHRASPLTWPRVGVYDRDDLRRFRLKISRIRRLLGANGVRLRPGGTRRPDRAPQPS